MTNYSNTAVQTWIASAIGASDLTFQVADATGYPAIPFRIVLDPGVVASEEVCQVTNVAGTTFTVTRGYDGTTAKAHASGAVVIHAVVAADITDLQAADAVHIADTTNVHGIADTSALVLDSDTRLTNSRAPSGQAGGVLGGTYPDPVFAVDMATQAELDTHASLATAAHGGIVAGTDARLTDWVNVRAYGAIGDGSADDTLAIQAAITAQSTSSSGSGVVFFPAGTYKVTAPIDIYPQASATDRPVHLLASRGVTIRAGAAIASIFYKNTTAQYQIHSIIDGFTLDGNMLADTAIKIDVGNFITIRNIQTLNTLVSGIDLGSGGGQVYECLIERVRIIGQDSARGFNAALRPDKGIVLGANATDNIVKNTIVKNCKTYGVHISGASNFFQDVHVYGYPEATYSIDYHFYVASGSGHFFDQCYADGPYVSGFYVGSRSSVVNSFVLWNASNPPVGAVGFQAPAGITAYTMVGNIASASLAVTLASTNRDFLLTSTNGLCIGNQSNIETRGGTNNTSNRFTNAVIFSSTINTPAIKITGVVSKTANYTMATNTEEVALCNATSGSFTITLPSIASVGVGRRFVVKKTDASANTVTVDPNGSETIDGALTYVLSSQWQWVEIYTDGSAWYRTA